MANTHNAEFFWTHEKQSEMMQDILRSMLVAAKISEFKEGAKYIENPYTSTATVTTNSPMAGTYSVQDITITDDELLVNTEEIYPIHIMDYEKVFADYDLGLDQLRKASYELAKKVDQALLTELSTNASNTVTVAGGFTSTNVFEKMAEVSSNLLGYDGIDGYYCVIDNTQTQAFIEAGAGNGFSFADSTLNNGMFAQLFGFDIYVVRAGILPTDTAVAGVKKASTTGTGGSIKIEEKGVSGKTGMEIAYIMYHTSKLWNNNEDLVVKIDLAASSV